MHITLASSFFLFLFLEKNVHPKCEANFEIRRCFALHPLVRELEKQVGAILE